ncbi:IPT/TIG domain-containing protein [Algibacter sp. 2305UL17-15]|uniref:IPT/TIG domain-containing protein n=1 Tax=Algibacter sp. 2305UL17-15 TaxID=3231268 RepID=UPI003457A488
MKHIFIKFSFCILILLNFGCDGESEGTLVPTAVIPQIKTLEEGGVELIADFQNFAKEDELGFQISSDQGSEEYIISNPKTGRNSIRITTGLYQDKRYLSNAFIKTSHDFFSSHSKEFYASSGSYVPKIKTITPSVGYIGDLIEVHFSEKIPGAQKKDFNIKLHLQDAEIIDIVDEQKIICRAPKFLSNHLYYRYTWAKMSITYLDKVVPSNYEFNIKAPRIDSVSPKFIDWGGEIIIKGDFYKEGYPPDFFTVNINEVPVTKITKITPNEVRLEVSIHMFVNNPKILLGSNNRGVVETNTFRYYAPEITSFQQGAIGDEIEIIGNYFWPASYVNEVYFDDYKAEIISGESTKLVVKVPNGTYADNKAILKVSTTDELVSELKEFVFK